MAPELVSIGAVEGVPQKTLKTDVYAFGQVILEVSSLFLRHPVYNY